MVGFPSLNFTRKESNETWAYKVNNVIDTTKWTTTKPEYIKSYTVDIMHDVKPRTEDLTWLDPFFIDWEVVVADIKSQVKSTTTRYTEKELEVLPIKTETKQTKDIKLEQAMIMDVAERDVISDLTNIW